MEFRVLGPLEVWATGVALPLGTRKQQIVLALLLINANQLVGVDELVDEVWPENPPASAVANVRGYVGNLRRLLESSAPGQGWIARRNSGYVLSPQAGELDLITFQTLCQAGYDALRMDDLATAGLRLRSALAQWRGAMVVGLPRGSSLTARCASLEEEHRSVIDQLAETYLKLDEPTQAITLLREQVQIQCLRERTHALLMHALWRIGDVTGALAVFADLRRTLTDQLGIEPGRELQDLHQAILRRNSSGVTPTNNAQPILPGGALTVAPRPRELPPEVGRFVGRSVESSQILATLRSANRINRRRPAVVIVYGPGGVGKSALAVHVAHQIADDYPDGQIYVDLLGSTPGLRSLSTVEVLGRVLRSLGIPDAEVPQDEADVVSRFRTLIAAKGILIVYDNVDVGHQVENLFPASASCAVLVTSRRPMPVVDADLRLRLGGLSSRDGCELLSELTPGVDLDQGTESEIVELCDYLPLAVRIAAGRLAGRPDLSARGFVERLADGRRRLDELELDGIAIRSCIRMGYEAVAGGHGHVEQLAAQAFRLLGLLNVPDVEVGVVSALLGTRDQDDVRRALDFLVGAQLLDTLPGERYKLHDLVRLVAAESAFEAGDETTRTDAVFRALAYYAGGIRRADVLMRSQRFLVFSHPPDSPNVQLPQFDEPSHAKAWVEAELSSLVAATEQSSDLPGNGRRMTLWIGSVLWEHLFVRHQWHTLRNLARLALSSAERHGDDEMAGWANLALGRSYADLGDWDAAIPCFEQALTLLSDLGNHRAAGLVLNALGVVSEYRGDTSAAEAYYASSLDVVRRHDAPCDEAVVLMNLGSVYGTLGRWNESLNLLKRSLAIRIAHHDTLGMGSSLCNLAIVHGLQGDLTEATSYADEALAVCQQTGDWIRANEVRLARSEVYLRSGSNANALADADAVLSASRVGNSPYLEVLAAHQRWKALIASGRAATEHGHSQNCVDLDLIRTRRDRLLEGLLFSEPGS